ncbi:hypothetical protein OBV_10720 [Oscillibacter valericigenes Sjm18-20]|nr:hypothetical protein OBV_10720 [Oscillibacter valericigenes Sjm18-20]
MRILKKTALIGAAVLVVGATSVPALAASNYNTPGEIVSGLTGKSVESVTAEKIETGNTLGALADEYGVLDQFKTQMLEQKKALLEERVTAGTMTQERADAIVAAIEDNQANCDGTGNGGTGAGMGAGFGRINGNHGAGSRNGAGCGLANGYCAGSEQTTA